MRNFEFRRSSAALTFALLAFAPAAHAQTQDYPNRTVTIVAPAAPGGLYSLFARLIGTKLEQRFGKPFIVENKPGAGSVVGVQHAGALARRRLHADDRQQHRHGDQRHAAQEPALRSDQRLRADRADRARAGGAGGQRRAAGAVARRSCQAREIDARRPDLRLGRAGHRAASQRRAAQERARRRADARALQGHAAGDQRRGRRAHPVHVQPDPVRAAARRRPASCACSASPLPSGSRPFPTCRRSPRSASRTSTRRPGSCWWRPARRRRRSSTGSPRRCAPSSGDPAVRQEFVKLGLVPVRFAAARGAPALRAVRDRALGRYREGCGDGRGDRR